MGQDVPTPAHHMHALDSAITTAAVVLTGTAAAATAWMTQLDVLSRILAIIATLLNIVWVVMQMTRKQKRPPRE